MRKYCSAPFGHSSAPDVAAASTLVLLSPEPSYIKKLSQYGGILRGFGESLCHGLPLCVHTTLLKNMKAGTENMRLRAEFEKKVVQSIKCRPKSACL